MNFVVLLMSICERLFELLGEKRGQQEQLASYIGVAPTTITNWKKRNTDPPAKLIIPICEFLNIPVNYLLSGEEKSNPETDPYTIEGISPDAVRTAIVWDSLDEAGKVITKGEIYRRAEAMSEAARNEQPQSGQGDGRRQNTA